MYETNNKCCSGCGWNPELDWDDKNREECEIDSKCCNGFVKEQFTLDATATTAGVRVYAVGDVTFDVAGTVKLINPTSRTVALEVDNKTIDVGPNSTGAITVRDIDHVRITSSQGTARVQLCFDIQVPSPAFRCCPSGSSVLGGPCNSTSDTAVGVSEGSTTE